MKGVGLGLGVTALLLCGACSDDSPATTFGNFGMDTEQASATAADTDPGSTGGPNVTSGDDLPPGTTDGGSTEGPSDTTSGPPDPTTDSGEESTSDASTGPGFVCGDAVLDPGEQCDDTDLGGEDCTTQGYDAGTLACAGDCTFDTSGCVSFMCGNGAIEGAEACDGADLAGESCQSQGYDAGTLGCAGDCTFDASGCLTYVCGNAIIEGTEECDGANLGGDTCLTLGYDAGMLGCTGGCALDVSGCVDFTCGNGVLEGMEQCDGVNLAGQTCQTLGFDAGVLACSGTCSFNTGGCTTFTCGNGIIEGMEACDGANLGGQTCFTLGFDAGVLSCGAGCAYDTSGCIDYVCGNGIIEGAEACDGANLNGQTCVLQGYDGGALGCAANCLAYDESGCAIFGGDCCAANGTPGCDDPGCTTTVCASDPFCCDNQWDAGCAADATASPACAGVGGSCPGAGPTCGNGLIDPGELCDGANLQGEDCVSQGFGSGALGCTADCLDFDTSGCMGVAYVGDCCTANGSPGCQDAVCTAAICAADPFCCDTTWDNLCATAAQAEPACVGAGGTCPAAGGLGCVEQIGMAPSFNGSNVGGDSDLVESCGLAGAETVVQYTANVAGVHVFDAIGSNYDTVLAAFVDCGGAELACNDDFAGNPLCGGFACSQVSVNLAVGQTIVLSIAGYNGATGNWVINVTEP